MCYLRIQPPPKANDLIRYTYCPHIITEFDGQPVLWSQDNTIAFCGCCCHYMCSKCHSHHPNMETLRQLRMPDCHWGTRQFIFMVERFCDLSQKEQGEIWRDAAKRSQFYMETPV